MVGHNHTCCHHRSEQEASSVEDFGAQYSLHTKINLHGLECLNETVNDSVKNIFTDWPSRQNSNDSHVISDSDDPPELLINIPFTGNVKIRGIIVMAGDNGAHPTEMRLYKNQAHMTFDSIPSKSDQSFELAFDADGLIEYVPKPLAFSSVHHLSIHFPDNRSSGRQSTEIFYIGLKGDFLSEHRATVVNAVYESRPNIDDHRVDINDLGLKQNNVGF